MDLPNRILSDIAVHTKYAKYLPEKERRETWEELVTRNKEMHLRKYPGMRGVIEDAYKFVYERKVLPSMRSAQFAGKPIEISPSRIMNCAYLPIDHPTAFSEVMFLLLGGTGVGFSVQFHHIEDLSEIRKPPKGKTRRYLIGDSIEGWADAVKILMRAYFEGRSKPVFDYSDIRPKGARLVTSGGKAPGPEPLRVCLTKIDGLLSEKQDGDKLKPIEVHDIICLIADAVLAGGIRRAALISLFSATDLDMLAAKSGTWWEEHPHRGRANNSVVLMRHRVTEQFFKGLWQRVQDSGCGEPGFFFTNDKDMGCNPCNEAGLKPYSFCNLTEVNAADLESQEDYEERCWAAAVIGTLQAGYTDFHYLRPCWQRATEKDALLGVGMTGIASGQVLRLDMGSAAETVKKTNAEIADMIGINHAARCTVIKPSGTSSIVLGCSSGVHDWHAPFYIRRIRLGKNEAICQYLMINHPELLEDDVEKPHLQSVLSVPQKAPDDAWTRTENPMPLLDRVKDLHDNWIKLGHRRGANTHNVSATISVPDDKWEEVGQWLWDNRESYGGLSVLPYSNHTYRQAPFEECDEETYQRLLKSLKEVDLTKVIELTDNTDLQGELACAGGACEVK